MRVEDISCLVLVGKDREKREDYSTFLTSLAQTDITSTQSSVRIKVTDVSVSEINIPDLGYFLTSFPLLLCVSGIHQDPSTTNLFAWMWMCSANRYI